MKRRRARGGVLAFAATLLATAACKHEDETPPVSAQPAVGTAPQVATPTPGGVAAPSTAAPAMPPAFGFFCATDNDALCPFARCIGGRCGGCSSLAECKPNTQCLPSVVGQICVPSAAPTATPPIVASVPAPSPPPVVAPPPVVVPAPAPAPGTATTLERARQLCVQRTNEYRARVGLGPLSRRNDAEACEDAQARADGAARTAHGAFGQCRERAQNECPGWDGAPEDVIERCLAMMFAEGPGAGPSHGHYVNMTDTRYRGVSCGVTAMPNGQLWVVQDFFP